MPLAAALPYIALAASVAGTGMQMAGAAKARRAMESTRAEFAAKQKKLEERANAEFQANLDKNTRGNVDRQLQAGEENRQNIWEDLNKTSQPIASALQATGSNTTNKSASRANAAAQTWNQLNAKSKSAGGAFGDWKTNQGIENADTAQKLGVTNNFSEGEARLLPLELDVASHSGDQLSAWGGIVGTLGSIAGGVGGLMSAGANAPLTAAQSAAMNAGYGPVSAATAAGIAPSAIAAGTARIAAATARTAALNFVPSRLLQDNTSSWTRLYSN